MNIEKTLYQDALKDYGYYKKKIKELLEKKALYVLIDNQQNIFVSWINTTDWVSCYIFEDIILAQKYIESNELENQLKIMQLTPDNFRVILNNYFYKGLTGFIYGCYFKGVEKTVYIPADLMFDDINDNLITPKNKEVLKFLLGALYGNKNLNYLFNPLLSADEIIIGIVKYLIREQGSKKYITFFENREIGEKHCKDKNIKPLPMVENNGYAEKLNKDSNMDVLAEIGDDSSRENYPITTVNNEVLFYSLKILLEREIKTYNSELVYLEEQLKKAVNPKSVKIIESNINVIKTKINKRHSDTIVRIYKEDGLIDTPLPIFFQLVINAGFETLDLS